MSDCLVALDGVCTLELDRTVDETCSVLDGSFTSEVSDSDVWIAGNETCDAGDIHPVARLEALERTNMYRWFARRPAAENVERLEPMAQECALMQLRAQTLDHFPPENWACYSEAGADASGKSNLHLGPNNPADAVSGFVADRGESNLNTLGHRRWVLHPTTTSVGFGYAGLSAGATCMVVHEQETSWYDAPISMASPSAFPSPGPFPLQLLNDGRGVMRWSVTAKDLVGVHVSLRYEDVDGRLIDVPHSSGALEEFLEPGVWIEPNEAPKAGTYIVEVHTLSSVLGLRINLTECPEGEDG